MKHDIYSILSEVLEIIDYSLDKKRFIQQFQEITILEAMLNVYEQLPQTAQQKIKEYQTNPEKLKQYIPATMYKSELEKVTEAGLKEFISSVSMELVPAQKRKIAELLV